VVAYQNILKLSYVDKFLNEIQLRFRDKYKQEIQNGRFNHDFSSFKSDFNSILKECEAESRASLQQQQKPKSYQASAKSQTTVGSMVEKNKPTMLGNLISSISSSTTSNTPATTKANSSVEATKDKQDADSDSGCEAGSDGVASNNFDDSKLKSLSLGKIAGKQGKFVPKK
jgi:signal recognition particle receptor subunit alpha